MKKAGILLAVFATAFVINTQLLKAQEVKSDVFKHTVFFWLKNPDNKADREAFESSLTKFIDHSLFVQSRHLGIPADTNRKVVDNTYTYCLQVTFKSKEEHDKYQAEEAHKIFIEESSDLWEKVIVYDSENLW
ncbi:Dabb family protein [Carboxylicivirga sp. N1Y90]|uniref:Dabb family protein n=1 Tax=Carboxylicivirga fragile TaxID=3417571 RepID=UPI003D339B6B|nr:Dabb family protein [Marinilabiliaceae bacterium N1Y90]